MLMHWRCFVTSVRDNGVNGGDSIAALHKMHFCRIVNCDNEVEFQPSPFFSEQLTAFELWLEHGSKDKKPPEQLPIVLQVRSFTVNNAFLRPYHSLLKSQLAEQMIPPFIASEMHQQAQGLDLCNSNKSCIKRRYGCL